MHLNLPKLPLKSGPASAIKPRDIKKWLADLPMIKDVDTSLESGDEEIRVSVAKERALQAGLSSRAVAL